jgi:ribonuclease E
MTRRMLIDAAHEEETRVVVMDGNRVVDYDAEIASKRPLKGNIYLAKVTRVEPSLQAAFVEYGGNRHGFLAFNEIHPDYYKIPIADREKLMAEEAEAEASDDGEAGEPVETVGGDDLDQMERRRASMQRRYKIQEVIKRRQILLVQVVKEERGTKGAALTTYLSLPGRYCVLMPNTSRGGGISRKITNARDRKRLKSVIDGLSVAEGMAVILRTAGSERSKVEIKRDYDYLMRLWNDIREMTLASTAPALIYEEGNLIKRTIRDLYDKDIEEILVDGENGYKAAKEFMRTLIPSHAKKVKKYAGDAVPLFQEYNAESLLESIHTPTVQLRSGGYIVIHQTEALVAIDVNSGRATRERHIEETALKTNCEAADEIAYQLRLRDLAGLIVIDFIDMEENRNNHTVERRFKDGLRNDRARIQIGRISPFGLLEMSRQRLRPSLIEITGDPCPHCDGTGYMQSTDWMALQVLRAIEEEAAREKSTEIELRVSAEVALYLLNQKRQMLSDLEQRNNLRVIVRTNGENRGGTWEIETLSRAAGATAQAPARRQAPAEEDASEDGGKRRRRGRRRRGRPSEDAETPQGSDSENEREDEEAISTAEEETETSGEEKGEDEERGKRRRRRGRRGGRRRNRSAAEQAENGDEATFENADTPAAEAGTEPTADSAPEGSDASEPVQDAVEAESAAEPEGDAEPETEAEAAPKPRRARRPRRRKAAPVAEASDGEEHPVAEPESEATDMTEAAAEPEAAVADEEDSAPSPAEADAVAEEVPSVTDTGNGSEDTSEPEKAETATEPAETPEPAPAEAAEVVSEPEASSPAEPPRRGWWQRVVN